MIGGGARALGSQVGDGGTGRESGPSVGIEAGEKIRQSLRKTPSKRYPPVYRFMPEKRSKSNERCIVHCEAQHATAAFRPIQPNFTRGLDHDLRQWTPWREHPQEVEQTSEGLNIHENPLRLNALLQSRAYPRQE